MKNASKVVLILLLSGTCFAAGAFTAGLQHWFQPLAHVTVRNDSGQDLESLVLKHESSGKSSIMALPSLKQGESTDARFFVAGEGGYQIEAGFPGGRVIKGGAGYVESGYMTTEVIGKSGIHSR